MLTRITYCYGSSETSSLILRRTEFIGLFQAHLFGEMVTGSFAGCVTQHGKKTDVIVFW